MFVFRLIFLCICMLNSGKNKAMARFLPNAKRVSYYKIEPGDSFGSSDTQAEIKQTSKCHSTVFLQKY